MKVMQIPSFFHDVFGEQNSPFELFGIIGFGIAASSLVFSLHPDVWQNLPLWRVVLLGILTLDIFSGCVANFSHGTSKFYATRPRNRLAFIALHVQPIIIAFLLGSGMQAAMFIWGYTIVAAFIVNALHKRSIQTFVAGLLVSSGIFLFLQLFNLDGFLTSIFLLFLVKVSYSFAVNHYVT